jgi:hypothetical protein
VNWEALVPVNLILEMDRVPPPVFLIVKLFCVVDLAGVSSIIRVVADTLICGPAAGTAAPLPERKTVAGLPGAL